LVRVARSGRPILAIDGCPLACCLHGLASRDVVPAVHIELGSLGLRKRQHEDLDDDAVREVTETTVLPALEGLKRRGGAVPGPA
jgi:uncharacterized metal-binding protein